MRQLVLSTDNDYADSMHVACHFGQLPLGLLCLTSLCFNLLNGSEYAPAHSPELRHGRGSLSRCPLMYISDWLQ